MARLTLCDPTDYSPFHTVHSVLSMKKAIIHDIAKSSTQISLSHWKDWCWSWNSNTLATWCEELNHWKRPWCWERLKAGGKGDVRAGDGWMASPTQWTWVWVNSRSWRWTGKRGTLQSMGSQRVRYDWMTELNLVLISTYLHGTQPPKSLQMVIAAMKLEDTYSLEGKLW